MNAPLLSTLNVAFIGNPNTGKSTLFNALAGMRTRVGNYPGVTVEKKVSRVSWNGRRVALIDLPGTYSLAPRSLDEMVSIEVLLGRQADIGEMDVVVCVLDASNLERNMYLASQVLSLGCRVVLVLNMSDVASSRGMKIDAAVLEGELGVPVVVTEGHRRVGLDQLREAVLRAADQPASKPPEMFPDEFRQGCRQLRQALGKNGLPDGLVERLLIDCGGQLEQELVDSSQRERLESIRQQLKDAGCEVPALEARARYRWIRDQLKDVVRRPEQRPVTVTDRLDQLLTHRVAGLAVFVAVMFLVFQAIYTWCEPLMALIEAVQGSASGVVASWIAPGPLRSLLVDGVVAGVGSVLVFLPQIVVLFLFIALLEDCGYMARVAFLMDKLMTRIGLSGRSFVPLMSSFACAIPGVMATRVIENRRDRMITILIAPLMSCSARLPVYVLLIWTFVPDETLAGWISVRALVLLAMSSLGLLVAIPVAWLLKRFVFPGPPSPLVMELPDYKMPTARIVLHRAYDRGMAFVTRAGSLIFATTILVWAAGYFPGDHSRQYEIQSRIEALQEQGSEESPELAELERQDKQVSSELIQNSLLGRAGRALEPAFRPLGWDWRIGVAAIASFPAREVIIATLGTIFSLGGDVDEQDAGLQDAMRNASWPDGQPLFGIPVALSVMVFFALCAQCGATLMIIRRETNSWWWPLVTFVYMTALAYVGAWIAYQVAASWGA